MRALSRGDSMAKTKKITIVYVPTNCFNATRFKHQEDAEAAAIAYSQQKGYGCEAFFCEKEHENGNGSRSKGCWHVRGRVRPIPKGFEGVRLT